LSLQQLEIESATKRLIELRERIKNSSSLRASRATAEDQALEAISQSCLTVSHQLLSKLNKLRIEGGEKHRGYKSFRQALKSVWAKKSIDGMAARLAAFEEKWMIMFWYH
jgi:hypothetical protein